MAYLKFALSNWEKKIISWLTAVKVIRAARFRYTWQSCCEFVVRMYLR